MKRKEKKRKEKKRKSVDTPCAVVDVVRLQHLLALNEFCCCSFNLSIYVCCTLYRCLEPYNLDFFFFFFFVFNFSFLLLIIRFWKTVTVRAKGIWCQSGRMQLANSSNWISSSSATVNQHVAIGYRLVVYSAAFLPIYSKVLLKLFSTKMFDKCSIVVSRLIYFVVTLLTILIYTFSFPFLFFFFFFCFFCFLFICNLD